MLKGQNGKPITNECLNVWMDEWHNGTLMAPTNRDGVIVLHFAENQVTADSDSSRTFGTHAVLGPEAESNNADSVFVAGNMNLVCQEYGNIIPDAPVTENLPNRRMASYSLKKILETGVAAGNSCGKTGPRLNRGSWLFLKGRCIGGRV